MSFKKKAAIPLLLGSLIAVALVTSSAFATHSRPIGAAQDRIVFVPAFKQCITGTPGVAPGTSPFTHVGPSNSTHDTPLADPACIGPVGPVTSSTNDSSAAGGLPGPGSNINWPASEDTDGRGSGFIGWFCEPPAPAGTTASDCGNGSATDESDIAIIASVRDVRCSPTATAGTRCGLPNIDGDGPDYAGTGADCTAAGTAACLLLVTSLRVSDHLNETAPASGVFTATGTKADTGFGVGISCIDTVLDDRGGFCSTPAGLTADDVVPDVVKEDSRGGTELGQFQVLDAGENGTYIVSPLGGGGATCPPSCSPNEAPVGEFPFLRQGIFVP